MVFYINRFHYSTNEMQKQLVSVVSIGRDDEHDETVLCLVDGTKRYARMSLGEYNKFVEDCAHLLKERGLDRLITVSGVWYQRTGGLARDTIKKLGTNTDVYQVS